jgi:hypothetical protein
LSRTHNRIEQGFVGLERESITPVVGQDDNSPWAHGRVATSATAALEELGGVPGRLVLQHRTNIWIIETNLEGGSGDDDIGVSINAGVSGGGARDAYWPIKSAKMLRETPELPRILASAYVSRSGPSQSSEASARLPVHATAHPSLSIL